MTHPRCSFQTLELTFAHERRIAAGFCFLTAEPRPLAPDILTPWIILAALDFYVAV
jgi:hypothetical protein